MFTAIHTTTVFVTDQDKALDFYVGKLGFEKRQDEQMGPDNRRIEVAPPGTTTTLLLYKPTPDMPGADTSRAPALGLVGGVQRSRRQHLRHRAIAPAASGRADGTPLGGAPARPDASEWERAPSSVTAVLKKGRTCSVLGMRNYTQEYID